MQGYPLRKKNMLIMLSIVPKQIELEEFSIKDMLLDSSKKID